jgi:hypothetical protein
MQPDAVEEGAEIAADLLLADDRWPRLVRVTGVAVQHQPPMGQGGLLSTEVRLCP